ncbi:H-2 class I histocompatibility antigen, D-37 alpha chain isoform X2 [Carassius gibelio]|uniref:H-2 class I histocompatibility antigen, D-37 alpha chain isoform X2 n=1 Tax=Carassius gibelio TaxID=101364 RepID=UPI002279624A|nr:H-2 class I histocompatibility antigen, D-37 alpha chain isoform X2 [Carassius gibelio]
MFLPFVFIILLFHSFLGFGLQEKHYLHFKFTAFSKANTLPEFSAEAVADGRQIRHYNNKDNSWVRSSLTEDDWTEFPDSRDWFIHQMKTLSNCTNTQCSELHILQRKSGCELERYNGTVTSLRAFDEYGFDGEDFIAFNSDTLQWIYKNIKAKEIKIKWDQQTKRNELLQHFLKTCMNWISTVNNTKKTPPDVHVFVRKAPDDDSKMNLSCLATGFYPRDIEMNIRLDKINTENKISSGIRPNDDGSFQMRVSVKIDRDIRGSYDCFVIHRGLTEPAVVEWEGNYADFETESQWSLKAVLITVSTVLVLIVISYCIYRRKRLNGGQRRSNEVENGGKMTPHSHRGEMASPEEFHVLQKRIGCEVVKLHDGKVISLKASDESAYDGKDFISQMYNQPLPGTKIGHQTGQNSFPTDFHKNCMDWISTFNNTFKTPSDVHVFARKSPDDHTKLNLSCLATGFYPRDIEMYIRLNRVKLEDQISSEIRPNDDETFQMRSSVEIDINSEGSYDCFVIHSSLTEPVSVKWDGRCFNCEPDTPLSAKTGVVIGVAIIIFLILIVYCFCIQRRRSHGL